jgi:sirohydrochlorin ferrochelatase
MEAIADRVKQKLKADSDASSSCEFAPFTFVKLAHLEFTSPSIADVCDEFEALGVDRIISVPIFISVSSHTGLDIPNAFNVAFNRNHEEENIRRYLGKLPVTLCPPLDHGALLPAVIAEAAAEISRNSDEEAALILSHGDGCEHFWNHLLRRVAMKVTEKTGVRDVSWVTVQTGRSPASKQRFKDAADALLAKPHIKRVLVLSCFTGLSGSQFLTRLCAPAGSGRPAGAGPSAPAVVGSAPGGRPASSSAAPAVVIDDRLVGDKGWAEHPLLAGQIAEVASAAGAICSGTVKGSEPSEEHIKCLPPYNPPFYLTRDLPRGV